MADWVHQALSTAHDVVHGLYPEALASQGLGPALESLAIQAERLFGLTCKVEGDVPEGLISSFPCTTDGRGNWSIVQGLEIVDFSREKISVSIQELIEERDTVAKLLS